MSQASFVQWHLTNTGYRVTVYDSDCQPVKEYDAGNHPLDSQSVAPSGHALSEATLINYAKQTSRDFADEFGLPHSKVSRDTDSEDDRWN